MFNEEGHAMQKEPSTTDTSHDAAALRAACKREGCPVCTVVLENMERLMSSWSYEGFTDVEHREELIRSRAFCPLHTWQLAQHGNTFQLAVIYREVLTDMAVELDHGAGEQHLTQESGWMAHLKRRLRRKTLSPSPMETTLLYTACPFCRSRTDIEQRLVQTLVRLLVDEEVQMLLRQSTGLCQLHFLFAREYARARVPDSLPSLIEGQHTCLQRTLEEVQEQLRKHDYRFSEEPHGAEMTSWRRAAQLCAGNPGVW